MANKRALSIPAIPEIPAGIDKSLYDVLAALKEAIEVGEGRYTDAERVIRNRDLEQALVSYSGPAVESMVRMTNGRIPPAPTDLTVENRVFSNVLRWTNPADPYDTINRYEVWVSLSQSRSAAYLLGGASADAEEFVHNAINTTTTYYYWIRAVSHSGIYSTWEPPDQQGGYIVPPSHATVNEMLDTLLDESGTYQSQFKVVADSFQVIQPISSCEAWDSGTTYGIGVIVSYSGAYFSSKVEGNLGNTPVAGVNWDTVDPESLDSAKPVFQIGTISGEPAVGIRGNLIVDGTIVGNALEANTISADRMMAHDVFSWTLQSGNYYPGISGFKIDCDPTSETHGRAEFNDIALIINYNSDIIGIPQSLADISPDEWDLLNGMQGWTATNFIDAVTHANDIEALQAQIDGAVETWFYSGQPGPSVLPESGWLSPDIRADHVGDLYFDEGSGIAYRYKSDYTWQQTDDLTAQALQLAQGAYDLADNKRRVFIAQPSPPYDAGDLWIDKTTSPYEIAQCSVGRETGAFNAADWGLVARNISGTSEIDDDAGLGQTANWQQVSGIPYATIFNNDDSVAFGFNPTFSDWPGALPAGWTLAYGAAPAKETVIKRVGEYSVKFVATGVSQYIYASTYFSTTPLPVGAFLAGTYDIYLASGFSGTPGLWIGLYLSADYSQTSHHRFPATAGATGTWQRVPFVVRPPAGGRIYGFRIYIMPSWGGAPLTLCTGTCYFDNLRFAVMDNSLDNTAISIAPDGTLSGAGGGQVTITGMGYVGDLDATNGAPPGTMVGGVDAEVVVSNASNGAEAYTGTEAYRNASAPTNNGSFGTITSGTATVDGNVVVTVNYTYSQGAIPADQLFIFVKQGGGTVTADSPCFATNAVSGSMSFPLIPSTTYAFGIQAVRRTESGLVGTAITSSANIQTIAGNYTGSIAGSAAATVAENAAQAITATNNMAADGYLSAQEKAIWRVQWPGMQASYDQIIGQATSYGIQALSQFTGLTTARNNLYNYLATTLQAWSDPNNADVISPSTQLTTYVQAFYDKLQIAANKIADYAHTAHGVDDGADNTMSALGGVDPALVAAWSNDPAARINAKSTVISGGKIETGTVIAGGLAANITLTNYLYLGNTMQVDTSNPIYFGKYGGNKGLFLDGETYKSGFFRDSAGVYHFRVNGSPSGPGSYASGRGMSFSSDGDFQVFGDIVATGNVKARNINTLVTATASYYGTSGSGGSITANATTANLSSDGTNGAGVVLSGYARISDNGGFPTLYWALYRGTTKLIDGYQTIGINQSVTLPVYFHDSYTGTNTYKLQVTASGQTYVYATVSCYIVATAPLR